MLTKWKIALPLLLGSAVAQQFTDWVYDYDVDYYTSTCKTAINKTLECNTVLESIVFRNNEPTGDDLEKLCTKECEASLIQTQKDIVKACPVAQNNITLQHGGLVSAQDNIRELLDGFTKACLKDPNTGKFCLPLMGSWPLIKDHTREQNCSDCALRAMQLGLNSEVSYNEKVASEFSVLTESCQKTGFDVQVPTKAVTSPASGTKPSTTMTTIPCETPYTIHAEDTCNGICKSQNVSTYAFTQTNRLNIWCDNLPKAGTVVCLPKTCDVYTVEKDDTCGRIAYKFSRYAPGFSMTQLISWNPTINDVCSNMGHHVGMQICVSPPGLGHLKPSATSDTDAPITPAPEPSNLANGTNAQCAQYYNITKGDTCADVTMAAGISLKDFYFLNPSVDKKCTNLILGESYCVRAIGEIETYPGYTSTFSKKPGEGIDNDGGPNATLGPGWRTELPTSVNKEKPLASGTWDTDKCRVYYKWAELSDDELTQEWNSCEEIARRYRTTVETLKKWNPSLAEASPCIINKKDRYCVYLRDEYRSSTTTTTAHYESLNDEAVRRDVTEGSSSLYARPMQQGAIADSHLKVYLKHKVTTPPDVKLQIQNVVMKRVAPALWGEYKDTHPSAVASEAMIDHAMALDIRVKPRDPSREKLPAIDIVQFNKTDLKHGNIEPITSDVRGRFKRLDTGTEPVGHTHLLNAKHIAKEQDKRPQWVQDLVYIE